MLLDRIRKTFTQVAKEEKRKKIRNVKKKASDEAKYTQMWPYTCNTSSSSNKSFLKSWTFVSGELEILASKISESEYTEWITFLKDLTGISG